MKSSLASSTGLAILLSVCALSAPAQDQSNTIFIDPLFEYVQAPDSMRSIHERSDFIMEHFWDPMDFKKKESVDQNALNDAFEVYVTPMRWAQASLVDKSINKLLTNLSKNPTLSLQFTRAAEEALYGPRAVYWQDEIYLKFVNGLLANKKVPQVRKERYKRHKTLLSNTLLGETPKNFSYTTPEGNPATYEPTGVLTVIEFGDPSCDECRFAKLKLETDITFSDMVEKGKINVLFIIPDPEDGWQTNLTDFSPKWHTGASDTVTDIYDIRAVPSFYVIGRDGKVIGKNMNYREAMRMSVNAIHEDEAKN